LRRGITIWHFLQRSMRTALDAIIRNSYARDNLPSRNDRADSLAPSVERDLSRWTFFSFALGPLARKEFRSRPSCAISCRRRRRILIVLCVRGVSCMYAYHTSYDDDDDGVRTVVYLPAALSTTSRTCSPRATRSPVSFQPVDLGVRVRGVFRKICVKPQGRIYAGNDLINLTEIFESELFKFRKLFFSSYDIFMKTRKFINLILLN